MTVRKRQFGTEKDSFALPVRHTRENDRKLSINRIFIVITLIFWVCYVSSTIYNQMIVHIPNFRSAIETCLYIVIVTLLDFSALMYLIEREGALKRFAQHTRVPRQNIDTHFSKRQPKMTVLVPSYDEEIKVIRQTLLSAALQEYPDINIVLLLDDKPRPSQQDAIDKLERTKAAVLDIGKRFEEPSHRLKQSLLAFENKTKHKKQSKTDDAFEAAQKVVQEYKWAADWLMALANSEKVADHVDHFFVDKVIKDLADNLYLISSAIDKSISENVIISDERLHQLYSRLVWVFTFNISYFQRKEYLSLSHEANKAMNLNSYINLMGGKYKIEKIAKNKVLLPVQEHETFDLEVPDSEYILTLDADSILLMEYCLRLVYLMDQKQNEKIAVTQTPYSSFRGSPTRIERITGSTTDIQHLLHQGSTHFDATFWVGANAVIRKRALEDIAEVDEIHGFMFRRFIQDRTVIEDTESSIDLRRKEWRLYNYPERLSYSATPPDFGSLVIQRGRWANGGLLILPKLLAARKQLKREGRPMRRLEFLIRMNYMCSVAWASFGLLFLLVYPFDSKLLSIFILLSAIPYFIAMSSDLKYLRYRRIDVFGIYGFNLLLLPVNLAGVMKSIQQGLTDKKIPFARTPKVDNRTSVRGWYVFSPIAIIVYSMLTCLKSYQDGNWANALFAGFNTVTALWATIAYIGLMNMVKDILNNFLNLILVEEKSKKIENAIEQSDEMDWRSILYYGEKEEKMSLRVAIEHHKKH